MIELLLRIFFEIIFEVILYGTGHLIVSRNKKLEDWCNKPRRYSLFSKGKKKDDVGSKSIIGLFFYVIIGMVIWGIVVSTK